MKVLRFVFLSLLAAFALGAAAFIDNPDFDVERLNELIANAAPKPGPFFPRVGDSKFDFFLVSMTWPGTFCISQRKGYSSFCFLQESTEKLHILNII